MSLKNVPVSVLPDTAFVMERNIDPSSLPRALHNRASNLPLRYRDGSDTTAAGSVQRAVKEYKRRRGARGVQRRSTTVVPAMTEKATEIGAWESAVE